MVAFLKRILKTEIKKLMKQELIFNQKKRRVLRKSIPLLEVLWTMFIILLLAGIATWVILQRDAYDPGERDIPSEFLAANPSKLQLYQTPFKAWSETGKPESAAQPELGFFPPSILDKQWRLEGRFKQFDRENLFEKINGEAEKFLQQGFESLQYVTLGNSKNDDEIDIELFDQGDLKGSLGVFAEYIYDGDKVNQAGNVVYLMTSAGAIGRKGRFFFRIMGTSESAGIRQKSAQLVTALRDLPAREIDKPLGFRLLTEDLGIDPSLVIFKENDVFQFDFASGFWFGRTEADSKMQIFLHQDQSPAEVQVLYKQIITEQSYDYDLVEQKPDYVLMWHKYLKTWFAIGKLGSFLFGVENQPDKEKSMAMLKKIVKALPRE